MLGFLYWSIMSLVGALNWEQSNPINPPGPVYPPPKELWTPPVTAVSSGNYFYLDEKVRKHYNIYSYNSSNALISVSSNKATLSVNIDGNEQWFALFQGMSSLQQLEKGYFGDLQPDYPFNTPGLAGLLWDGNACNSSWFVLDEITYNSTELVAVKLRFMQHYFSAVSYGALNWDKSKPTHPIPVLPPPPGLWQPASVPASGNYVYLESNFGVYMGHGRNYTYTSNVAIEVGGEQNYTYTSSNANEVKNLNSLIHVRVDFWSGYFKGMESLLELQVGYYGGLQGYPFHNRQLGGLSWGETWSGCQPLSGWFVIESIQYTEGEVSAV